MKIHYILSSLGKQTTFLEMEWHQEKEKKEKKQFIVGLDATPLCVVCL